MGIWDDGMCSPNPSKKVRDCDGPPPLRFDPYQDRAADVQYRLVKGVKEAREGRTVTRPEFPDRDGTWVPYTRTVLVHGAPGYDDFVGEYMTSTEDEVDDRGKLAVVRMVLNDPLAEPREPEYAVVPLSCVYVRMEG